MSTAPVRSNPLTNTVLVLLLSEGWAVKRWLIDLRQPDLFGIIALIHAAVLTTLYLRKSPAAGTFLFYTVLPIYPLYFLMTKIGYAKPIAPPVAAAMFAVWIAGSVVVWRERRSYDDYIAPIAAANQDPATPRDS